VNIWQTVEHLIIRSASREGLFNPYGDHHNEWDRPDAVGIRTENLKRYIDAHDARLQSGRIPLFLLMEAPGPWGCRFSGVPITSEAQLVDPDFPGTGKQSTKRDTPFSEYSASIYWRILQPYWKSLFTWNTVPMHPFHPGKPDSIRAPRQSEINDFLPVLKEVVLWAQPLRILAVGRKAENALSRISVEAEYIRHPSQGGARIFEEGVSRVINEMGIEPDE
jgi:hypothetical protein